MYRHETLRNAKMSIAGTEYDIDGDGVVKNLDSAAVNVCKQLPQFEYVGKAKSPESKPITESKPEPPEAPNAEAVAPPSVEVKSGKKPGRPKKSK